MRPMPKVFVALDTDDTQKIDLFLGTEMPEDVGLKFGPRFVFQHGVERLRLACRSNAVFLDFKFFDIPNTVSASLAWANELGVQCATVHGLMGAHHLKETLRSLQSHPHFQLNVISVSLLTSFSEDNLPSTLKSFSKEPSELALEIVREAHVAGIRHMVCSPWEVAKLKGLFPDTHFITPGIRFGEAVSGDDQARVATPQQAFQWGASSIVVGRPVVESADPLKKLEELRAMIDAR